VNARGGGGGSWGTDLAVDKGRNRTRGFTWTGWSCFFVFVFVFEKRSE